MTSKPGEPKPHAAAPSRQGLDRTEGKYTPSGRHTRGDGLNLSYGENAIQGLFELVRAFDFPVAGHPRPTLRVPCREDPIVAAELLPGLLGEHLTGL